jgi:murein DD-endopeptidase MepM/ murein hydrolase activator NlpD
MIHWLAAIGLSVLSTSASAGECARVVGELTQGAWLRIETEDAAEVSWNGAPLALIGGRLSWVGLGRDEALAHQLEVRFNTGASCSQSVVISPREYAISIINGVPQRTVTPPKEDAERIRKERNKVAQAKQQQYECATCIQELLSATQMPLLGRISGVYGSQRVYNGVAGNPHYGLDIARPTGTPVRAPVSGLVVLAEDDLYYSGGTVILHHGYGVTSSFLHLSAVHVKVGDFIAQGDLLGDVGATGRATGPHLDWRMNFGAVRVDPKTLFSLVSEP